MLRYGTLPARYVSFIAGTGIPDTLTAVDNIVVNHILPGCRSLLFVDPRWLKPLVLGDQTELNFGVGESRDASKTTSEIH